MERWILRKDLEERMIGTLPMDGIMVAFFILLSIGIFIVITITCVVLCFLQSVNVLKREFFTKRAVWYLIVSILILTFHVYFIYNYLPKMEHYTATQKAELDFKFLFWIPINLIVQIVASETTQRVFHKYNAAEEL
jgi:amino acid transporter